MDWKISKTVSLSWRLEFNYLPVIAQILKLTLLIQIAYEKELVYRKFLSFALELFPALYRRL